MKVVDLFSGIGGFSLGFKWEGFECVGYDNYKPAVQTYRYNIGEAHLVDLSTYTPKREADVVIAGPPCTPYTTLNFKNRGEKHPAYHLVERTLEIIRDIKPRVYVIENTPSIRSFPNYTLLREGIEGYDTWELEVNYINFGAAIHRKRLFFVGSKAGYFDIPRYLEGYKENPRTLKDVISDLDKVPLGTLPDHEARNWSEWYLEKRKKEKSRYGLHKISWNEPIRHFGGVGNPIFHPSYKREMTIRELLRIFGFPDSFVFPKSVSKTAKYRMMVKVVSPLFSRVLAEEIKKVLVND